VLDCLSIAVCKSENDSNLHHTLHHYSSEDIILKRFLVHTLTEAFLCRVCTAPLCLRGFPPVLRLPPTVKTTHVKLIGDSKSTVVKSVHCCLVYLCVDSAV